MDDDEEDFEMDIEDYTFQRVVYRLVALGQVNTTIVALAEWTTDLQLAYSQITLTLDDDDALVELLRPRCAALWEFLEDSKRIIMIAMQLTYFVSRARKALVDHMANTRLLERFERWVRHADPNAFESPPNTDHTLNSSIFHEAVDTLEEIMRVLDVFKCSNARALFLAPEGDADMEYLGPDCARAILYIAEGIGTLGTYYRWASTYRGESPFEALPDLQGEQRLLLSICIDNDWVVYREWARFHVTEWCPHPRTTDDYVTRVYEGEHHFHFRQQPITPTDGS